MTQDDALEILKTGLNVFLTGEPGSGKTHTVNRYIAWLSERGVDVSVTASTGIAATHVNGMTIHSWSGIGIKRDVSDYDVELIMSKEKTAKRILDAKVLVIDEVSMLDARTLESVERVLRMLRRKPMTEGEPFGGLQVIFVGDFFQLPPISRQDEAQFAFESNAWKAANPIICYLTEQHRQDDGEFLEILGAMRQGTFGAAHRKKLQQRIGLSPKDVATRLYTHNADVDRMNDEALQKITSATRVYQMTSRGADTLVQSLKKNCLSPETLVLKEGAAVMFTRNNFDEGYVNGSLGDVVGFSALGEPIVRLRNGRMLTVQPAEWAIQDGERVLAKISQVPLRLAWAITVHKSQGMTLDSALIDLGAAFEYGQGYVAISRVRSLSGLYLESFNERALELHPAIVAQDRYFRAYSEAAAKKFAGLPNVEREKLQSNFLRAIGGREPIAGETKREKKDVAVGGKLGELREKHPNAYRPWSNDEDDKLEILFNKKMKPKDIAEELGRQPGAIRARLMHLELIPNIYKDRAKKK